MLAIINQYKNWILGGLAVVLLVWMFRKKTRRTYVRRRTSSVARRVYSGVRRRVMRRRK